MQLELLNCSSTLSSNGLVYIIPSSPIEVPSSLLPLLENLLISSSMIFAYPWPIALRLMDKLSEPIRNSKCIFASSAPITQPNGYNSFLPPSSTIILPLIAWPRSLRFPYSMVMNLALTLYLEKPSFLLSRNDCPDSRKPKRKPSLPTILLKNSWLLGQLIISIPGKLEIRSGLRPLISDYTTLLGNSLPKDKVLSKSFRYYLPSPTNSDYPSHGGYMMYSTPPSYPLITPLNYMVLPLYLCLLMSLTMKRSTRSKPYTLTRAPVTEDCTWPHGKDIPHLKISRNLKLISITPLSSWTLVGKSTISGNGVTPSQQSLREYLLAAVPVSLLWSFPLPFSLHTMLFLVSSVSSSSLSTPSGSTSLLWLCSVYCPTYTCPHCHLSSLGHPSSACLRYQCGFCHNWGHCDQFCPHCVCGTMQYPWAHHGWMSSWTFFPLIVICNLRRHQTLFWVEV